MLVKLTNVKKIYKSKEESIPVEAIKGVTIDIEDGKFISFIGPSGAGKTTLLNMIGCMDKASEGEILIDGTDINKLGKSETAKFRGENIGFIFQNFNLIPVLTIFENVEYPLVVVKKMSRKEAKPLVDEMLREVGMEAHKDKLPNQISGGQKQRIAVARALVMKPKLVLADEPTANLDSENAYNIMRLMHDMKNKHKTTFIFSTHDPKVVKEAEIVYEIEDGKIKGGSRK